MYYENIVMEMANDMIREGLFYSLKDTKKAYSYKTNQITSEDKKRLFEIATKEFKSSINKYLSKYKKYLKLYYFSESEMNRFISSSNEKYCSIVDVTELKNGDWDNLKLIDEDYPETFYNDIDKVCDDVTYKLDKINFPVKVTATQDFEYGHGTFMIECDIY